MKKLLILFYLVLISALSCKIYRIEGLNGNVSSISNSVFMVDSSSYENHLYKNSDYDSFVDIKDVRSYSISNKEIDGVKSVKNASNEGIVGRDNLMIRVRKSIVGSSVKKSVIIGKQDSSFVLDTNNINKDINIGKVVYYIPDTMIMYKTYDIIVRISRDSMNSRISNIKGINSDKVIVSNIKTSQKMEVEIIDGSTDSSFDIKRINDWVQIVDYSDYTEWSFIVTPIRHGNKNLRIVISVITGDNKKQVVYINNIRVRENIIGNVETFWDSEWKWLFTTILIPIFVYFWKKNKK